MSRPQVTIEELWSRLTSLAGERFTTKTGLPFTFTISGANLRPSRTEYNLTPQNFALAMSLVPCAGPGDISDLVRGPAYVWAILHDTRVRGSSW